MEQTRKHTPADLAQMQALPLELKIRKSKARIREWYEHWDGMVYVSFSGGKDSTVLKHLVEQMYNDVPSVFVNTGLEYPEIQKFAMSQPNVEVIRPKMRFDEVIKTYGYPIPSKEISGKIEAYRRGQEWPRKYIEGTAKNPDGTKSCYCISEKWKPLVDAPFTVSDRCCSVMKKGPSHKYSKETGRMAMVATMAEESNLRRTQWMKFGCNAFEATSPTSKPLSFWTEQDILQYLKKYNVPYCSIYGEIEEVDPQLFFDGYEDMKHSPLKTTGVNRTGCMFCMFGVHMDKRPNRFERMKETHPKQYAYCMKPVEEGGLGLDEVLTYCQIPH